MDVLALGCNGRPCTCPLSGIQIKVDSPIQLSAEIKKLFAGFLGFTVEWEYDITYTLTRKTDQSVLITKPYHMELKSGKAIQGGIEAYGQAIDELILKAYEQLISDPKVQELLGS